PTDFLASLAPTAPSNYLPNIDYGEQTLLNTREYVYAPFFNRMKRQMEMVWNPGKILTRDRLPFRSEYRTVIKIVLNEDGTVQFAKIVGGSSNTELDREALRAVYRGAPYLNPPAGLLESRGGRGKVVLIPDWHFIVTQRTSLF